MDVLRFVHEATAPGGWLVEAHPVPSRPPVEAGGAELGRLDDTEFGEAVAAAERALERTVAERLFVAEGEREIEVVERFDDGADMVQTVSEWEGVVVPPGLAERAREARGPVDVRQRVVYRRYRRV